MLEIKNSLVGILLGISSLLPTGCEMTPQGQMFLQDFGIGMAFTVMDEAVRQGMNSSRGNQNNQRYDYNLDKGNSLYDEFNDPYNFPELHCRRFTIEKSVDEKKYVIYGARKTPFGDLMKVFDPEGKKFVYGYWGKNSDGKIAIVPREEVEGNSNTQTSKNSLENNILLFTYNDSKDLNKNGIIDFPKEFIGIKNIFNNGERVIVSGTFGEEYQKGNNKSRLELYSPSGEKIWENNRNITEDENAIIMRIEGKFNIGSYKCVLYLNNKIVKTHEFEIRE